MAYTTRFGKLIKTGHNAWPTRTPLRDRTPATKADKGKRGGSCNRTDCQRPGAHWYNHSTEKYYCSDCAHWLNTDSFNRKDAHERYGHDLCTYDPKP